MLRKNHINKPSSGMTVITHRLKCRYNRHLFCFSDVDDEALRKVRIHSITWLINVLLRPQPTRRTSWKLVGNPGCELVAN